MADPFGFKARDEARRRATNEAGLEQLREERLRDSRRQLERLQDQRDDLARQMAESQDTAEIRRLNKQYDALEGQIADLNKNQGLASIEDEIRSERATFDEQQTSARERREADAAARRANIKGKVKTGLKTGAGVGAAVAGGYALNAYNQLKLREASAERQKVATALRRAMEDGDVTDEDYLRLVNEYGREQAERILAEGREAAAEGRNLADEVEEIDEAEDPQAGLDGSASAVPITFYDEVQSDPMSFPPLSANDLENRIGSEFDVGLENLSTGLDDRPREQMNFPQRVVDSYLEGEPILTQEPEGSFARRFGESYPTLRENAVRSLNDIPWPLGQMMSSSADFLLPDTADRPLTNPLDAARTAYTFGELTDANDPLKPLFREGLSQMGRQPLAAPINAVRSPAGRLQDDMFASGIEQDRLAASEGSPTAPNIANSPQSLGDLMLLEQQGLLPYPGNARENAEQLGIPVAPGTDVRPSHPDTWEPGGLGAEPDGRGTRETDPRKVIDQIIQQDEVLHPRGQRPVDRVPDAMNEPPKIPDLHQSSFSTRGAPFAAWAAGNDGELAPAAPGDLERDIMPSASREPRPIPGLADTFPPRAQYAEALPQMEGPAPPPDETPVTADPGIGGIRPQVRPSGSGNAAVGTDYAAQKEASAAGLAEDAEESERELNKINTWMRDKLGMDASERAKWADSLIRMGATMMQTPGNLGEALGAGINAGLDTYQGLDQQEFDEMLAEEELAMRRADERRKDALEALKQRLTEAELSGVSQDQVQVYLDKLAELEALGMDANDPIAQDLARVHAGIRKAPATDDLIGMLLGGGE